MNETSDNIKTIQSNVNSTEQKTDRYTVVIADWEMKCCGTPFKVGDTVEWFVSEWICEKLLVDIGGIDFYYDRHCADHSKLFKMKGKVEKIFSVHYAYKKESESSNLMIPT